MRNASRTLHRTVFVLSLCVLAASTCYAPAEATLIELEPDMFRVGTNVTNLFEGVTISRYLSSSMGSPSYGSVYVEAPPINPGYSDMAATGTHTFGRFSHSIQAMSCWAGPYCDGYFSAMLIQFDTPTNYFDIAASYGWIGGGDNTIAYAFDSNRQFVGSADQDVSIRNRTFDEEGNAVFEYAGIARIGSLDRAPYISSIIVGGWDTNGTLDRIRFNSVPGAGIPEPSTLLLLGFGLSGLLLWRRRQAV